MTAWLIEIYEQVIKENKALGLQNFSKTLLKYK
jgi:hypothetical protein